MRGFVFAGTTALVLLLGSIEHTAAGATAADQVAFVDPTGVQSTLSTTGPIDTSNPFFQQLGTNGRACVTCHRPAEAWTVTPAELQERFAATAGLDPIFRNNDGSNCEGADLSTLAQRRRAFTLLLSKALIRVGLAVPPVRQFDVIGIDDPYACGVPVNTEVSMYRRPLPSTNLGFLSTVMWDGRETAPGQSIRSDLTNQALDATMGHAQGAPPTAGELQAIVDFETGLFTAQILDSSAGVLTAQDASGGPGALSMQPFCLGINDPLGTLPNVPGACSTASAGLDRDVFTIFRPWQHASSPDRQAIARGEAIFNTFQFTIDNVPGLNGGAGDPVAGPIANGTCTVCHDTPNAGNHSVSMPLNIGVADAARRTRDLPLYTLQNRRTLETVQVTDPGRAMITGNWADIGKFKGPVLRALAARAPYFHNGSAATLGDVVDFYQQRFHFTLSAGQRADLIRFLNAL
jgi:hypothetical protein